MFAQIQNPVDWTATSKKISDKVYEIHLTANLDKGWHIYSQSTPDGGPLATSVSFSRNPLLTLEGTAKEAGKLEQKHEALFGVDVKQYSDKVEFVQTVRRKGKTKTAINGTVEFMTCNDRECLPPVTKKFSVVLQ